APSSQASAPLITPSPQLLTVQISEQAAVGPLPAPSSQASTPAWTRPSPQVASWQVAVQASLSSLLPSSHASSLLRTPSPQAPASTVLQRPAMHACSWPQSPLSLQGRPSASSPVKHEAAP